MEATHDFFRRGIYSVPEASRLTGISAAQIRRWIRGYKRVDDTGVQWKSAVFDADYPSIDNVLSLSFLDLVEVQFIQSFRQHGVSWKAIRLAAQRAADLVESEHPFAKRQFFTDGKSILTRIAGDCDNVELLNLVHNQYELDRLVSPLLYENLDFGELDFANRWWPTGRSSGVVVDPLRNLGKPIVERYNVPTSVLADMVEATGSIERVADWYEIDLDSVREAVTFEGASRAA